MKVIYLKTTRRSRRTRWAKDSENCKRTMVCEVLWNRGLHAARTVIQTEWVWPTRRLDEICKHELGMTVAEIMDWNECLAKAGGKGPVDNTPFITWQLQEQLAQPKNTDPSLFDVLDWEPSKHGNERVDDWHNWKSGRYV